MASGHRALIQVLHEAALMVDLIKFDQREHTRLIDLERKLRCTRCGNRARNTLMVRMAPRD